MINLINSLKFKLIRIIESSPRINLFLYNNISFFKPFLPHEKDYYGIKLLINKKNLIPLLMLVVILEFQLWALEN